MDFLKKRGTAAVILVIVICLTTVWSASRGLRALASDAGGELEALRGGALANCSAAANGIVSIAVNYPELQREMTTVRTARNAMLGAETAGGVFESYGELRDAFYALSSSLGEKELTDSEAKQLSAYISSFDTGVSGVESSGYNDAVRKIREKVSAFPAGFFAAVTGFETPEIIGQEN